MNSKNAVLYCRTAHPAPVALDAQKRALAGYARENDFQVVATIAEYGYGWDYSRKGLKEICRMAETKEIDVVLVANIDRLGRDTAQTVEYLCCLKDRHVDVICADGTAITQKELDCRKALYEKYKAKSGIKANYSEKPNS